tara:strand:+ start:87 stop:557 length:471 start_codon:yes stop_codon:yes gene_type:complete
MPPKKKGGNNNRQKNIAKFKQEPFAGDSGDMLGSTEYAKVIKALGECRFTCLVNTGQELVGKISGGAKKRGRVIPGDIVLVSRRDFETGITRNEKLDILHKYREDTVRQLLKWGDLEFTKTQNDLDIDGAFVFSNEELGLGTAGQDDDDSINFDEI